MLVLFDGYNFQFSIQITCTIAMMLVRVTKHVSYTPRRQVITLTLVLSTAPETLGSGSFLEGGGEYCQGKLGL